MSGVQGKAAQVPLRIYRSFPPPTKRSRVEDPSVEPTSDTPLMTMSLVDVPGPSNVPVAKSPTRRDTCSAQDEAHIGPTPVDDDLDRKDATALARAPS